MPEFVQPTSASDDDKRGAERAPRAAAFHKHIINTCCGDTAAGERAEGGVIVVLARRSQNPAWRDARSIAMVVVLGALTGCGDDANGSQPDGGPDDEPSLDAALDAGPREDAGGEPSAPDAAASDASLTDAGDADMPISFGGLTVTTTAEEQELDLFGAPGHRLWIEVNAEQLARMNAEAGSGGFLPGEDIYEPVPGGIATFADHLLIEDVASGSVADYGQVEVALVGESTLRTWDFLHIPNLRIDADEFEQDKRIGGFEHIRLNNAQVGSIFRETIAHRIYRELGYPALHASFAFLGSNVWGDDVWIPMTLIEMYKKRFCNDNAEALGGTCLNMWEFAGDIGDNGGGFPGPGHPIPIDPFAADPVPRPLLPEPGQSDGVPEEWCQVSECDNARFEEFISALEATPPGPGFKDALAPFLVWDRFHQFQCLSWILWTGDDPIHNANNNLILERDDGKFIWAPYSIDISAGQDWYLYVPLTGASTVARGCQSDPSCWADTISACEQLVSAFDALDPENLVDETQAALEALAMLREGDQERAQQLREWFVWRGQVLAEELERFRYLPDLDGNCPEGLLLCGDEACGTPEQCAERTCAYGSVFCESRAECVDLRYDTCPICEPEQPLYCRPSGTCVATVEECDATCYPGSEYCPAFGDCAPIGECPPDEDGGVPFPVEELGG